MNELVFISSADFVAINLFLESVSVDTEHLCRLHLIAIVDSESQFDQRLFNLLQHDFVKSVELDLRFVLLLEKNFQFTTHELFKTDGLKICDEKTVRVVHIRVHCSYAPNHDEIKVLDEKESSVKLLARRTTKYICEAVTADAQEIAPPEFSQRANVH